MGYFSNGTEGQVYREDYCDKCLHDVNNNCAVWNLHLTRNYAECNNENSILHELIPIAEDGLSNEQCRMYVPNVELCGPLQRLRTSAGLGTGLTTRRERWD